ncbi:MAG: DNA primase [Muribaculaceae bacterium]|nr:DNA primase [Muribaculaceae bacterium]
MGRIDQDTVNRIIDAADIVEVVSDFVKLRRSGANYKGLCPFHNERTPSFSVNKARNICKCFSCGKGGSPVNFIMEHEQMSYQEALRYLARKYNIEIVEKELSAQERQAENDREAMLAVNDFALKQFRYNLHETADGRNVALQYFRHRGLSDAMIERFHLGYALDRGTALIDAAHEAGYVDKYLIDTGLAGVSERDGQRRLYDRFRGRVLFPIHTISGRVVAFGGRTMRSDKTVAKYVNSPESVIYKKNLELYGLYQAKSAIAKRDKCILVEGYLDVISMHQAGVENVVASSGTSLTEGQIRAIRRFTNNVTVVYDADPAGIKASLRGIKMLLSENMNVRTLLLPQGEDPDSFAQSHSSSEVEAYLAENERDIIDFMVEVLMRDVNASDPMARAKVVNTILETIACIDEPVKRQEYISLCSRLMSIAEEVLIPQLNIFIAGRYEEAEKNIQREMARASIADIDEAERKGGAAASADGVQEAQADSKPLLDLSGNRLRPYEAMLARYLVRYGLLYIVNVENEDKSVTPLTTYDVIEGELSIDNIALSSQQYAAVFKAVGELRHGSWLADRDRRMAEIEREAEDKLEAAREEIRRTGGSIAQIERADAEALLALKGFRENLINDFDIQYCQSHLINSPDDVVRSTALELVVDKYTLSKIYAKSGDTATEQDNLYELVQRAVCELRNTLVSDLIADLTSRLNALDPSDADAALGLLRQIADYKAYQQRLAGALGARIILTRR